MHWICVICYLLLNKWVKKNCCNCLWCCFVFLFSECFGPYTDGSYAFKRILGKGVEIQKCLKHEKDLMAGFVRIHGDCSMSGKATNNTVMIGFVYYVIF